MFESAILQRESNRACLLRPFNKLLAHGAAEKNISNLSLKFGFLFFYTKGEKNGNVSSESKTNREMAAEMNRC